MQKITLLIITSILIIAALLHNYDSPSLVASAQASPSPCPPCPCASPTPTATPTPTPVSTPSGDTIIVDPNTQYQTMNGWEATAQAGQDYADWDLIKNNLMDQAVRDGFNRLRVNLRINTEANVPNLQGAVNDNADPFVINPAGFQFNNSSLGIGQQAEVVNMMRSRLATRGEVPYVVLCYVDFRQYAFEHHTNPEEYAELMEATFLHLNSVYGWVPDAVEILLEPDHSNAGWTAAKMANALIATRNRLAGYGWHPSFIAPSTTLCDSADVWFNAMKAANPSVVQYIDELSYHRYGGGVGCTQGHVDQNQAVAEANGIHVSMLEKKGGNYDHLRVDLKAGAAAWQQHALGFDAAVQSDSGNDYYRIDHTNHTVTIASRTKFLRQYFKFIRRGAVRISATSGNANFDPLAFINPDGKYVLPVKALAAGKFSVALPAGTYGIKYTTASRYDIDLPDQVIGVGGVVTATIPAAGVITIYGK